MPLIKNIGIYTGAVVGGLVGGSISFVGKIIGNKMVDEIGESVLDSSLTTGQIAGQVASGAVNIVRGVATSDKAKVTDGVLDIGGAANTVAKSIGDGIKCMAEDGITIVKGTLEGDKDKIKSGARSLAKTVIIGALTIGVVEIKPQLEDSDGRDRTTKK